MEPRNVRGVCQHGCGGRTRTLAFGPSVEIFMEPRNARRACQHGCGGRTRTLAFGPSVGPLMGA
eukprot:2287218-Pyramimonas_sp.AAC.1